MTLPAPSLPDAPAGTAATAAPAPRRPVRGADRLLAAALFVAVSGYLLALPASLNPADESYFLLEAARIRAGEVMYRDFFNFITPLASYAMAGLFWAFGTTIATARAAMAVVHAITAVALFATARRLDVGRALALLPPLAYLALCQSVWPYASWHWVSTGLTTLLVYAFVAARPSRPPWHAMLPGLLAGLLVGVQQQKGVVLSAAGVAVLIADCLIARRDTGAWAWGVLLRRLAWFVAGIAAVVVPVLGAFILLAGPTPLYDGLVRFPLESYRPHLRAQWGAVGPIMRRIQAGPVPVLLRLVPLWLIPVAIELAAHLVRRRAPAHARQLAALLVLAAASIASIAYYPDLIHIAFIAGVFWVAAARALQWLFDALPGGRLAVAARALLVVALAGGLLVRVQQFAGALTHDYPIVHETAFGEVAFRSPVEPRLIDQVRALAAAGELSELFCYPYTASAYLTTGVPNATPYQFLLFGISPKAHIEHTLAILRRKRLPYVIASPFLVRRRDPLLRYIEEHYRPLPPPDGSVGIPPFAVYRRLDLEPADTTP